MTDKVEPDQVKAIRAHVAAQLALGPDEVELEERRVPGSDEDQPKYATLYIPHKEGLTEERVNAAVKETERLIHHPRHMVELRWEWNA